MSGLANYWGQSPDRQERVKADEKAVKRDNSNPNIVIFGKGPMAKICGGCAHLTATNSSQLSGLWCDLTNGWKAKAHSASWPACARFQQVEAK